MKKIIYYWLNFRPGGNGRIIFRLDGEGQNRFLDLSPADFSAITAVLSQKRISYDTSSNTFVSFDDDQLPLTDEHLIS